MKTGRRTLYKKFAVLYQEQKKGLVKVFLLQMILMLLSLCAPYFYGVLIDDVMVSGNLEPIGWICGGYAVVFAAETVVTAIHNKVRNATFNQIKLNLRTRIWKVYMNASWHFYGKYGTGDMKERLDQDVDKVELFVNEQMINYFCKGIAGAIYLIAIFKITWKLALFSLLMIPVAFWLTKRMEKGAGKAWSEYREHYGNYESWLQGSFQKWKEIKTLDAAERQFEKFNSFWEILKPDFYKGTLYFFLNKSFIGFSDFFVTKMNLYFAGGILILHGNLRIGMLFVFMKYYEKFFAAATELIHANITMTEYRSSLERITEILAQDEEMGKHRAEVLPVDSVRVDGGARLQNHRMENRDRNFQNYGIRFDRVSFCYSAEMPPVLKDFTLEIPENLCVVIVGRSGSGKTTLMKLLLGLYENYSGEILIGQKNAWDMVYGDVVAVLQDSVLFNCSIRQNLLYAKPDASKQELTDACKMACIHDDIMRMPEQYHTVIGEKGRLLSGGQRQRIMIARALLSHPKILIMDEATAALDSESENRINQALQRIKGACTMILIAHRLSAVAVADEVIVLENGTVAERGTFQELVEKDGVFRELFWNQMV